MAFLPMNIVLIFFFGIFVFWGWEGELMRRLFAVISATFMLPQWTTNLLLLTESGNTVLIQQVKGWLPTYILVNVLWWNVVLMLWTWAHTVEGLERDMILRTGRTPLGRRKQQQGRA
jgi:hypothetical protein